MPKVSVPFHRDFRPPTQEERDGAIGEFPGAPHASETRREMLLAGTAGSAPLNRPSLTESVTTAEEALLDLDQPDLFSQPPKSETARAIPPPRDDLDWLANVLEEGQTFEEYVTSLTSRSGRIRPIANAGGEDIVLLPIVREADEADGSSGVWPSFGPSLGKLVAYTRAFFDRKVLLLPSAMVSRGTAASNQRKRKRGGQASENAEFKLRFPSGDAGQSTMAPAVSVKGRANRKHTQLQVASVLDALSNFRQERNKPKEFCIMAVTMEDLFDGDGRTDLFCAGMAFPGSKVAVFSFFRYHPHLKMHPGTWHDFGYAKRSSSYSYYEDSNQNPTGLMAAPPTVANDSEFLRRSGKLLTHELGHLYGLGHCIYNRCLMVGTGHLVEDFLAPCHLCAVCLRKLQWRLGFDVAGRYALLLKAFAELGLKKEASWAQKQHARTSKVALEKTK